MGSAQFSDYSSLVTTVERWLARDDLTNDVQGFIWLAECDIQRRVNFRLRDAVATGTTIAGDSYITLPSDYVEAGYLNWTSDSTIPSMEVASYDITMGMTTGSLSYTDPELRAGVVVGDKLYIGPAPTAAVTYRLFYKAGVSHLGADNKTNLILKEYPDCLLFGALVCAAGFLKDDERLNTWAPLYENAKRETAMSEERARTGHGALRMRPEVKVF